MEKDKKIKLPEPIHIKKINAKLDLFSKNNVLRKWAGYDIVDTLFFLYLFNKYKQNCLIKYEGVHSSRALGLELIIRKNISEKDYKIFNKHLNVVAKQLSDCINKNPEIIIIPLYLKEQINGHVNLLIYRKKDNTIEHFEPHGSEYLGGADRNLIKIRLDNFIVLLNHNLKKNNKPSITLVPSNIVCPYIYGLQSLEENSKQKRDSPGYCAAWSMFFTELILKNPTIPSDEILKIIIQKFEKEPEKQANYLRNLITGYINIIHQKIDKYFYFLTGSKNTIDTMIDLNKRGNLKSALINYETLIDIQTVLFSNSSLTKKEYIKILEDKLLRITNANEKLEIDRKIIYLNKMDQISPSPDSVSLSKSKSHNISSSSSKSKKRSPTNNNKKTRKQTVCPEGSKINPETGRCNKIKVYLPCPPTRDPITHRCKRIT
jgi:hypothetical protein